jgi:hypothetical protein
MFEGKKVRALVFRTEKTKTEVSIPILPRLQQALDAGPTGELAFICGTRGKPFTKESFGNEFKDACLAAGVNKSAHGVRKLAATGSPRTAPRSPS